MPWLLGVARHKLADHYRRRHDRFSVPVAELPEPVDPADDWDAELDRIVAESVLARLPEQHRTVLALRYMDDCSVPRVRRADRAHRARHRGAAGAGPPRFQIALPGAGRRDVMNNSHDPLTVLHGDELPVQPDPAFAARLRARLESAANFFEAQPNRTQGVVMSGTDTAIAELNEPAAEPRRRAAAAGRAAVPVRRQCARGHRLVRRHLRRDRWSASMYEMDDGRIGHAELRIGDGVLYLADEYPEIGLKAPAPQAASVSLMLPVPDTDAALERAREHGAQVQREPYENYGARNATIIDPFGHRWMLSGPVTGAAVPIQHGDVGYVSVWTPDADRAAAFYGHVLGWTYDPATHQVTNTKQRIGIYSVAGPPTLFCCYAVADLEGARQAIVDGGGTVDELEQFDFGTLRGATDSHGTSFGVFQPTPGTPRPELNGSGRARFRTSRTR